MEAKEKLEIARDLFAAAVAVNFPNKHNSADICSHCVALYRALVAAVDESEKHLKPLAQAG